MKHWRKYENNPAGRSVGDCAVRAVAVALGTDWETAYLMLAKAGFRMADMPSANSVWGAVLRQNGFRRYSIPNTCPECYTAEQFAEDHPHGIYVLSFGNHVATLKDGFVMDTWDSTQEVPQYYWRRD